MRVYAFIMVALLSTLALAGDGNQSTGDLNSTVPEFFHHCDISNMNDFIQQEYSDKATLVLPIEASDSSIEFAKPILPESSDIHLGVDIPTQWGSKVRSAGDGVVALVGHDPLGFGTYIAIKHEGALITIYRTSR